MNILLLVILSLAFLIRLPILFQSLWLDEAIEVLAVRENSYWDLVSRYSIGDFHPPLYHLILKFWTQIFGFSEVAARFPSLIFGVLTVFLVYKIGESLKSKTLGLSAAFFMALAPLHIYYSGEARMYALAAFFTSLAVYFFLKLFLQDRLAWVLFFFSTLALLYTDYLPYLMFVVFWLYVFWQRENLPDKFLKNWLITNLLLIIFLIPWLPVFLSQFSVAQKAQAALPFWRQVVGVFSTKALPLTAFKFVGGRISSQNKLLYGLSMGLASFFLFLILIRSSVSQAKRKILIFLWLFLPVILSWILSIFVPIFQFFRLIFVLPAFYLLLAKGVLSFNNKSLQKISLSLVVLVSVVSIFVFYANKKFWREDWRSATLFVQKNINPSTAVLFKNTEVFAPYRYYDPSFENSLGAIPKFPAKEDEIAAHLIKIITNKNKIFLFDYLGTITDPKNLVLKTLEGQNFRIVKTTDFSGVGFVHELEKI